MKRLLLSICAMSACVNTAIAQVTISASQLVGTKWQLHEDYDSHSNEYYEFGQRAAIWHRSDGSCFSKPFYLSATIPAKFDFTKVGVCNRGCYYVEYNPKLDFFCCYSIMYFDKEEGKMVYKLKSEDVIGNADTFTFRLIK